MQDSPLSPSIVVPSLDSRSKPPSAPLRAVVGAFAIELLRGRAFWIFQAGLVSCLLWWRLAVPWSSHGDHGHEHELLDHAVPWAFGASWPLLLVWLWLARSLFTAPRHDARHPLSLGHFETPRGGILSFSVLRVSVECILVLLVASLLQVLVAGSFGSFHVEPRAWLANLLFAMAGVAACLATRLWTAQPPLRLAALLPLLLFPALLRESPAAHDAVIELAVGTALLYSGVLILSDSLRRTQHAIRNSW